MPRMTGIDALMAVLDAHEVEYVFGNPGTTEVVFMDALYEHPRIKYMLALHETVAMGMAGGYSWASRKTGFVNVHTAPGVANAISALYNANVADFNMVVTAGQQDTRLIQREPGLSGDLVGMTKAFTKWSAEIQHPQDVPLMMHRAFKMSNQQPQGPTFLSLPQDVLSREADIKVGRPTWVAPGLRPDPAAIDQAATLLANAKSPVLFLGFRVSRCGALGEAVELAELVGARVTENRIRAENAFPSDHPLFEGGMWTDVPKAHEVLKDADVVMSIGANFVSQLFYTADEIVNPASKVIHLDTDPWEIGKNQPTDIGILADIKAALVELNVAVAEKMTGDQKAGARERAALIADANQRRREVIWERAHGSRDSDPMSDYRLMMELKDAIPRDTVIVDGGITASMALRDLIDFGDAESYLAVRDNDGSLGDALPMAMGVKLAWPDRPVVGVVGDGNAMYSIQGLWTAAHHQIPVVWVICNNATYRILKLNTMRVLGPEARAKLHSVDLGGPALNFAKIAQSLGIDGVQVTKGDEVRPAIERALAAGKPAVVDAVIDGSF